LYAYDVVKFPEYKEVPIDEQEDFIEKFQAVDKKLDSREIHRVIP